MEAKRNVSRHEAWCGSTPPVPTSLNNEGLIDMTEKITKLAFEKYYDDGSGVRVAVRYDSTEDDAIEIMSIGEDWTASFPLTDLPWLLECLHRINTEIS